MTNDSHAATAPSEKLLPSRAGQPPQPLRYDGLTMPSFSDSIFIFVLALILFGPKKLPQLARQLGKLMAEFRRASNEFRMQMEDELRIEEQKEHQQKVAALAGPPSADVPTEDPPHPHMPPPARFTESGSDGAAEPAPDSPAPIAESGSLKMMPPSTGLPVSNGRSSRTVVMSDASALAENSILPPKTALQDEISAGMSSEEPAHHA